MTWGLTDAGYIAPRMADFLPIVRDALTVGLSEATGHEVSVDWARDVFLGSITANMAARLGEIGEATQAVWDALDPENAQGYALDTLCLLVGVRRRPATRGLLSVRVSGTFSVLPAGREIDIAGVRWRLAEDTANGTTGSTVALFEASDAGRVSVPAGPAQILTPVPGWSVAEVLEPTTVGQDRESDSELRKRRQQSLASQGSGSQNALVGALLALDYVDAAVVIDNDTAQQRTIGGVQITPHSVAILVYPGTLTERQRAEVALTIYNHAGLFGTHTIGSVRADIVDRAGGIKTVRFAFASERMVVVGVSVTLANGYSLGDVGGAVRDVVTDYFSAISVGDPVRRLALLALISTIPGVVGADVTLNGAPSDIVVELSEIATPGEIVVTT